MKKLFCIFLSSLMFVSSISISHATNAEDVSSVHYIDSQSIAKNASIIPFGNNRYRKKIVIEKSLVNSYSTTVSESEAKKVRNYTSDVSWFTGILNGFGGPIGFANSAVGAYFSKNYTVPFSLAGKYTIKVNRLFKYQKDILRGRKGLLEKGYELVVTHNGSTLTRTLWGK